MGQVELKSLGCPGSVKAPPGAEKTAPASRCLPPEDSFLGVADWPDKMSKEQWGASRKGIWAQHPDTQETMLHLTMLLNVPQGISSHT